MRNCSVNYGCSGRVPVSPSLSRVGRLGRPRIVCGTPAQWLQNLLERFLHGWGGEGEICF